MRSFGSVEGGDHPFDWLTRSPQLDAYLERIGREPKLHAMLPLGC
jgi:hypothetical protein